MWKKMLLFERMTPTDKNEQTGGLNEYGIAAY